MTPPLTLPHAHRSARDDQAGMWCNACAAMCRTEWPCDCCRVRRVIDAAELLGDDLQRMHRRAPYPPLGQWPAAADLLAALGREIPT